MNGTQNIGRLTFQEGTVNLTGGTINFGAVSGLIDGDATPDTISSVITGTNGVRFSGGTINADRHQHLHRHNAGGGPGLAQADRHSRGAGRQRHQRESLCNSAAATTRPRGS